MLAACAGERLGHGRWLAAAMFLGLCFACEGLDYGLLKRVRRLERV